MTKKDADKIVKGSKSLGLTATIQGQANDQYNVTFFHESQLIYGSYIAARMFLLSRESETGKTLG